MQVVEKVVARVYRKNVKYAHSYTYAYTHEDFVSQKSINNLSFEYYATHTLQYYATIHTTLQYYAMVHVLFMKNSIEKIQWRKIFTMDDIDEERDKIFSIVFVVCHVLAIGRTVDDKTRNMHSGGKFLFKP